MPASENTWRDMKTLHMVFGFTGLLLFGATLIMFGTDHTREWKRYQRQMRSADVRLATWRADAERARVAERLTQLESDLEGARSAAPNDKIVTQFVNALTDESQRNQIQATAQAISEAGNDEARRKSLRVQLNNQMTKAVQLAKFNEDRLSSARKFKSADYDKARADLDLAIRDNLVDKQPGLQEIVDRIRKERESLTLEMQAAIAHRKSLDTLFRSMNADVDALKKQVDDAGSGYQRLVTARSEREVTYFTKSFPFLGGRWLEFPVLDAFNSPLKIDNLWTKNLEMPNGSFGTVRRFDRCTTCHKAIDLTAPGSAVEPLYEAAHPLVLELTVPLESEETASNSTGTTTRTVAVESGDSSETATTESESKVPQEPTLRSVFGMELAAYGLIDANDATIREVVPGSAAATATAVTGDGASGLQVGDVIRAVGEDRVTSADAASRFLLQDLKPGRKILVTVERGLPQPFASHPRLDLFLGSLSPHKKAVIGCTVCHEGQGSATEFKFASHTPNDPHQQQDWARKHGWFNNHHWIFPMQPNRFSESMCLKCHHDVVELEMSAHKFSEPPAPKLMAGYHLIRENGCFGCHEINGYNGPDETVGPDMRLEPNYFAAAAQLRADPHFGQLASDTQKWIRQLVTNPDQTEIRHKLVDFLKNDAKAEASMLTKTSHDLVSALEDIETPGTMRKVGPSLRHVSTKVSSAFLFDWLRDPTHFRPSTRMPRFFGLWNHLDPNMPGELDVAQKYEPIEILGLVNFLLKSSQPITLDAVSDELLPAKPTDEQIARGKLQFETRGCLGCHSHSDFPAGHSTKGPDLSNVGDKFRDAPNAREWLVTWLRNPSVYHPRSTMPDLFLGPIKQADGSVTDVAADIAAYLLASTNNWQPQPGTTEALTPDQAALDALVKEHLVSRFYIDDAERILKEGRVPAELARNLTGSEAYLEGDLTNEKKLLYIGHKTVSKYGCYACHDIPGFESAKPIGTGLADWGRKDPSRLAFDHIAEYLHHGHGHGAAHTADAADHSTADQHGGSTEAEVTANDAEADPTRHDPHGDELDEAFYEQRLLEHDRTGFIWQKLKEPRSYDFKKTRNKDSYHDRLRMPQFSFNDVQREAVVTFVLGLVAEPPAYEFVYHPDEQSAAMIAGHKALTKFNCAGCHIIDPETWTLQVPAGTFEPQPSDPSQTFPFMPHQFSTAEVNASQKVDSYRGTVTATLRGMPELSSENGAPRVLDEEGDEVSEDTEYDPTTLIYPFELWEPTLLEGHTYQAGVTPIEVQAKWITRRTPTRGGDLTKLLMARAVELEKAVNPQADGKQVYGWLPPPLIGEGAKVQTDWLHDFLLNPIPIRPAVLMRMPKFNMSSAEATSLANYFAARDAVAYPYAPSDATDSARLDSADESYGKSLESVAAGERPAGDSRFDHVMNIVTSKDYCVQCHIVGDFVPQTSDRAKAPDLSAVGRRLRPDYLRRWIANPKQILPYTPMPVNVKYNATDTEHFGGVDQKLYHGTSLEQIDGLVDLLMNYGRYTQSKAKVSNLIPAGTGAATQSESAGEN